jgi:protein TonB
VVASEIQISISADLPPPPITIVTDKPQPPPPPPRPREPDTAIVATFPNPESMYPSAAKSADQEGRPVVSYCVDQNSKLTSAELVDTSGFPLLDEAAVRVVKGGKFKAATADRKPMASCKRVAIKFELKKSN